MENQEHRRNQNRQAVRLFDGKVLRHYLADNNVGVGDEQKTDRHQRGVEKGSNLRRESRMDKAGNKLEHRIFARPPQSETTKRNADLRYGEQARGRPEEIQRHLRSRIASVRHRAQTAFSRRNQRDLRRREERVQTNYQKQNEEAKSHCATLAGFEGSRASALSGC